jgi:hypothetical protein
MPFGQATMYLPSVDMEYSMSEEIQEPTQEEWAALMKKLLAEFASAAATNKLAYNPYNVDPSVTYEV